MDLLRSGELKPEVLREAFIVASDGLVKHAGLDAIERSEFAVEKYPVPAPLQPIRSLF
jgi:hypothetical protein